MFIQDFRSICKCVQLPKFTLFWDFLTTMTKLNIGFKTSEINISCRNIYYIYKENITYMLQ